MAGVARDNTVDAPDASPHAGAPVVAGAGIAAAALVLTLGNVLSRVLGLAREQLAAGLFGTGDAMAAFTVADNVQTLLFDLLVSGVLQAALIPVLARWAAPDPRTRAELRRVSGALLTLVALAAGAAVALGMVFAPAVVRGMTALGGGEAARGAETTALTVTLVRWVLPAVFLLAVGTVLMAALHAIGRPTAPALAVAARNAAVVAAAVALAGPLGVRSLALGVVLGAGLMAAMQAVALRRAAALPRPNLDLGHPAVRETLRLYGPIALGLLVSTAAVVVDRNLAWGAGEDALGAMRYATTLVQLVLGLVVAALSLAALPTLSRHHAAGDEAAFRATLRRVLGAVTVLIVPATLGLAAVGAPTVDLLFRHGATDGAGARAILVALLGYLPGTLCAAYDQVLIFAFYARRDTRTPVLVGVLAVGVYFAVALALVRPLGMLGLVLANSAQFAAHAAVMWWLARRAFAVGDRALARTALRCGLAGIATAAAAFGGWVVLDAALPAAAGGAAVLRELALVGPPIVLGAAVYGLALWVMKVPEAVALAGAVRHRFRPGIS